MNIINNCLKLCLYDKKYISKRSKENDIDTLYKIPKFISDDQPAVITKNKIDIAM